MEFLKRILDFYIRSSLHVGMAIMALVCVTYLSFDIQPDYRLVFTVFFGVVTGYNVLKYFEAFRNGVFEISANKMLTGLTLLSAIGWVYFFIQLNTTVQKLLLFTGILVIVYPILRGVGLLKMFYVAFCISIITVLIPLYSQSMLFEEFDLIFFQRIAILSALLIPFEISHSTEDDLYLPTIPQQMGVFYSKILGGVLLLTTIGLGLWREPFDYHILWAVLPSALAIAGSHPSRSFYYTAFWVESIPILWWLGILVASFLSGK